MIRHCRSTARDLEKSLQDRQGLPQLIQRRPEIPLQSTTRASHIPDKTPVLCCCRHQQPFHIRLSARSDAESWFGTREPRHETRRHFQSGSPGNDSSMRSTGLAALRIERTRIGTFPSLYEPFLFRHPTSASGHQPPVKSLPCERQL